jgi:hypothetical protein
MSLSEVDRLVRALSDNWIAIGAVLFALYYGGRAVKRAYDGFKGFVGGEVEAKLSAAFTAHERREDGILRDALREHVEMYHPRRAVPRRARR